LELPWTKASELKLIPTFSKATMGSYRERERNRRGRFIPDNEVFKQYGIEATEEKLGAEAVRELLEQRMEEAREQSQDLRIQPRG